MKIELSIASDYVPEWSLYEGVRELLQNARDAEVQYGATMAVEYNETRRRLVIHSANVTMDREVMLLGVSSKRERDDMIGHRGEGLKLGCLALVRSGIAVKIVNGTETWIPIISPSRQFGRDVLAFRCTKSKGTANDITVTVLGMAPADWDALRQRFRFLDAQDPPGDPIETDHGTLLLDPKYQGQVFVKGIWVETVAKLSYGYDFADAQLDRDRKMVADWDRQWKTARIWQEACAKRPDLLATILSLAEHGATDVEGFDSAYFVVDPATADAAARQFKARFGPDAVPVTTLADSAKVNDLGAKGIVVSKAMSRLLAPILPTMDVLREQLKEEIVHRYSRGELTDDEWTNLESAASMLHVAGLGLPDQDYMAGIEVAEFRDPSTIGLHKDGTIYLRRDQLADAADCLATLIHERCHVSGAQDGSREHVEAIEDAWTKVVRVLWGRN